MANDREIELKLALNPADAMAFRRQPLLSERAIEGPKRRRVFNIYFDTPELMLKKRRMALRLRRVGGKWLQTLKTAGSATAGLHQRGEWEHPLRAPELDLAVFKDTPLAKLPRSKELHLRLKPVFTTDFQRTTWLIETAAGQRVEVALDQGVTRCGAKERPVSEVEIELVEGRAMAVFDVARGLIEQVDLQPDVLSKAERGYRLFKPANPMPCRAENVELAADGSQAQALQTIAAACIDHFECNVESALVSDNPEYFHQLRVALRRLRSAMRIFNPEGQSHLVAELHWLTTTLGTARDWDVLRIETLPGLVKSFGDAGLQKQILASGKRRQAMTREAARAALMSRRHALLVIELGRWLSDSDELALAVPPAANDSDASPPPAVLNLAEFASREIRYRHKQLLRDAFAVAVQTAAVRHQVRIDAKRLRYAVDFFSSLFKKNRVKPYLKDLAAIQEMLGQANDAASAEPLIAALAPPAPFMQFAQGWLAAKTQAGLAGVDQRFERLQKRRHFWMKKTAAPRADAKVENAMAKI